MPKPRYTKGAGNGVRSVSFGGINMERQSVSTLDICPTCGDERISELNARTDANLRGRSFTLSFVVAVMCILAHIVFSYEGKKFDMPDILWVLILAPWTGASIAKVAAAFKGKK